MYPLFQCFLLILITSIAHIGITNPNEVSKTDYVSNEGSIIFFFSTYMPSLGKIVIWLMVLYQALYLLLQGLIPSAIPMFYPQVSPFVDLLPFTWTSMIGFSLVFIGGLGRIWCYRTLGRFFTFQVTIRRGHTLIQTGPYAYVRHPSYTFAYILMVGLLFIQQRLIYFFPNQWWVQILCGPAGILTLCIVIFISLRRRVKVEEQELSKAFGNEWTQYVSKTKQFLPGLF